MMSSSIIGTGLLLFIIFAVLYVVNRLGDRKLRLSGVEFLITDIFRNVELDFDKAYLHLKSGLHTVVGEDGRVSVNSLLKYARELSGFLLLDSKAGQFVYYEVDKGFIYIYKLNELKSIMVKEMDNDSMVSIVLESYSKCDERLSIYKIFPLKNTGAKKMEYYRWLIDISNELRAIRSVVKDTQNHKVADLLT